MSTLNPIPLRRAASPAPPDPRELEAHSFEALVGELLRRLGEDPQREGLRKTPERVRKSLGALTSGYQQDPAAIIGDAIFTEDVRDAVLVKDIEFYSLCEHHLLPFYGRVHITYVPDGRVVGLSKLPRLVEIFARRLQVQERMTAQIADAVNETLRPLGVGVITQAAHLCMMMRGVETQHSSTLASAMRGVLHSEPPRRDEFFRLALGRGL